MLSAIPLHPIQKITQKALHGSKAHGMKLSMEEEFKKKLGKTIETKAREKAFDLGYITEKSQIKATNLKWLSEENKGKYDDCEKRKMEACLASKGYRLNKEVSRRYFACNTTGDLDL